MIGHLNFKIQIFMFNDVAPKYELIVPLIEPARLIFGEFTAPLTIRIIDMTFGKSTGLIIRRPLCNLSCNHGYMKPFWNIESPRSASPIDKLAIIMATIVLDNMLV